jgi:hypothetical protein
MSGLEPVLIAAAIVYALVDTALFAVVFGALMHLEYLHMAFSSTAPAVAP